MRLLSPAPLRFCSSAFSPSGGTCLPGLAFMAARTAEFGLADAQDPDAAEGVVVADRVFRVEAGEAIRDFPRGPPVGRLSAREAKAPGYEMDVSVGRDHKPPGFDRGPEPEIEPVAPNHPAQVQVPAFAGGALRGVREEEASGRGLRQLSPAGDRAVVEPEDLPDDAGEQRAGIPVLGPPLRLEERAKRPGLAAGPRYDEEENRGVGRRVEAVPEPRKGVPGECGEVADPIDRGRGPRAERREDPLHVRLDSLHPAVGES